MFVNEHPYKTVSTEITFGLEGNSYWHNALDNVTTVAKDGKEDFAGVIRYEVTFDIENITDKTYIELSGVME